MAFWRNYPMPPPREPHDYTGFAKHLRGRVYRMGAVWYVEVFNSASGVVINSDGPYPDLDRAFRDAEARTHSARGAWTYSFSRKAVAG